MEHCIFYICILLNKYIYFLILNRFPALGNMIENFQVSLFIKIAFFLIVYYRMFMGELAARKRKVFNFILFHFEFTLSLINKRSRLIGFAISGTVVGSAIALPISGVLCEEVDWSSIFYIFGIYILIIYKNFKFKIIDNFTNRRRWNIMVNSILDHKCRIS
jgi:MFS family permease